MTTFEKFKQFLSDLPDDSYEIFTENHPKSNTSVIIRTTIGSSDVVRLEFDRYDNLKEISVEERVG